MVGDLEARICRLEGRYVDVDDITDRELCRHVAFVLLNGGRDNATEAERSEALAVLRLLRIGEDHV